MNITAQQLKDLEKNKRIKTGKYKSRGKWIDGIYFHSTKESEYYGVLKIRVRNNEIKEFRRQVRFKIVINGIKITTYVCDFVEYYRDGTKRVIDVKSDFTRKLEPYRIKKQLMEALYNIKIIEV